jgi:RimJ/RimL family protein N-acetyltransferase
VLSGERVTLRAVEPRDYLQLAQWLNDSEVMLYWGRPGNTLSVFEVERTEEAQAARGNSRKYIIETKDGAAIGQIDYYDLDWQARSAWVSILIGDPSYWGGGFGTEAMRVLLSYLFRQLGLHRVALTAHVTNERAQRSYQKNGFVREGILRQWAFFDGAWVDGVLMAVLDSDFARLGH